MRTEDDFLFKNLENWNDQQIGGLLLFISLLLLCGSLMCMTKILSSLLKGRFIDNFFLDMEQTKCHSFELQVLSQVKTFRTSNLYQNLQNVPSSFVIVPYFLDLIFSSKTELP